MCPNGYRYCTCRNSFENHFLIARLKFVQDFAFLRHFTALSSVRVILLVQAPFHFNSIDISPIFPRRRLKVKRSNQVLVEIECRSVSWDKLSHEEWTVIFHIYRFSSAQYENIGVLHYSFYFQSSSMDFRDDPINQLFCIFLNIWMRTIHNILPGLLFAFISVLISIFYYSLIAMENTV